MGATAIDWMHLGHDRISYLRGPINGHQCVIEVVWVSQTHIMSTSHRLLAIAVRFKYGSRCYRLNAPGAWPYIKSTRNNQWYTKIHQFDRSSLSKLEAYNEYIAPSTSCCWEIQVWKLLLSIEYTWGMTVHHIYEDWLIEHSDTSMRDRSSLRWLEAYNEYIAPSTSYCW
jgi:hypothetical protein